MRMSFILPVAAALAVAAIGLSSPADATTIKEAIKLCKQNPDCKMGAGPLGGYNFTVGTNEVFCPEQGECECLQCSPPKQRIGPFGTIKVPGKVTPRGVLTSSSGGAGSWTTSGGVFEPKSGNAVPRTKHKPEPKPVPTAEPKSTPAKPGGSWTTTTTTIPAKPRDHRRSGGGGTTVTTTRPGYDGAVKASGSGPSESRKPKIIDHRGVDPASRSGADERRKPKIIDHRAEAASDGGWPKPGPRPAGSVTP